MVQNIRLPNLSRVHTVWKPVLIVAVVMLLFVLAGIEVASDRRVERETAQANMHDRGLRDALVPSCILARPAAEEVERARLFCVRQTLPEWIAITERMRSRPRSTSWQLGGSLEEARGQLAGFEQR